MAEGMEARGVIKKDAVTITLTFLAPDVRGAGDTRQEDGRGFWWLKPEVGAARGVCAAHAVLFSVRWVVR